MLYPLLNIGIRAARKAGNIILRQIDYIHEIRIKSKGLNDFVSDVDRAAEQAIIETIHESYPDHAIEAEESGRSGDSEYCWIIDPLDGTTNYLHGFPHYAISIAVSYRGNLQHGIVYDPLREEMFTANRGGGAFLDNRRLRLDQKHLGLDGALLATGFPFRDPDYLDEYLSIFRAFFERATDIRRTGSAALDLAYVASSRLNGYWERGLNSWDIAAGILLMREASGVVTDFNGEDNCLDSGEVVAGSLLVQQEMVEILKSRTATNTTGKAMSPKSSTKQASSKAATTTAAAHTATTTPPPPPIKQVIQEHGADLPPKRATLKRPSNKTH